MKRVGMGSYIEKLKEKRRRRRVHKRFQLVGLDIAMYLEDERHKSLYIKMAKEGDLDELLVIAKRVAENKRVKNKGAYFMKIIEENKKKK